MDVCAALNDIFEWKDQQGVKTEIVLSNVKLPGFWKEIKDFSRYTTYFPKKDYFIVYTFMKYLR